MTARVAAPANYHRHAALKNRSKLCMRRQHQSFGMRMR